MRPGLLIQNARHPFSHEITSSTVMGVPHSAAFSAVAPAFSSSTYGAGGGARPGGQRGQQQGSAASALHGPMKCQAPTHLLTCSADLGLKHRSSSSHSSGHSTSGAGITNAYAPTPASSFLHNQGGSSSRHQSGRPSPLQTPRQHSSTLCSPVNAEHQAHAGVATETPIIAATSPQQEHHNKSYSALPLHALHTRLPSRKSHTPEVPSSPIPNQPAVEDSEPGPDLPPLIPDRPPIEDMQSLEVGSAALARVLGVPVRSARALLGQHGCALKGLSVGVLHSRCKALSAALDLGMEQVLTLVTRQPAAIRSASTPAAVATQVRQMAGALGLHPTLFAALVARQPELLEVSPPERLAARAEALATVLGLKQHSYQVKGPTSPRPSQHLGQSGLSHHQQQQHPLLYQQFRRPHPPEDVSNGALSKAHVSTGGSLSSSLGAWPRASSDLNSSGLGSRTSYATSSTKDSTRHLTPLTPLNRPSPPQISPKVAPALIRPTAAPPSPSLPLSPSHARMPQPSHLSDHMLELLPPSHLPSGYEAWTRPQQPLINQSQHSSQARSPIADTDQHSPTAGTNQRFLVAEINQLHNLRTQQPAHGASQCVSPARHPLPVQHCSPPLSSTMQKQSFIQQMHNSQDSEAFAPHAQHNILFPQSVQQGFQPAATQTGSEAVLACQQQDFEALLAQQRRATLLRRVARKAAQAEAKARTRAAGLNVMARMPATEFFMLIALPPAALSRRLLQLEGILLRSYRPDNSTYSNTSALSETHHRPKSGAPATGRGEDVWGEYVRGLRTSSKRNDLEAGNLGSSSTDVNSGSDSGTDGIVFRKKGSSMQAPTGSNMLISRGGSLNSDLKSSATPQCHHHILNHMQPSVFYAPGIHWVVEPCSLTAAQQADLVLRNQAVSPGHTHNRMQHQHTGLAQSMPGYPPQHNKPNGMQHQYTSKTLLSSSRVGSRRDRNPNKVSKAQALHSSLAEAACMDDLGPESRSVGRLGSYGHRNMGSYNNSCGSSSMSRIKDTADNDNCRSVNDDWRDEGLSKRGEGYGVLDVRAMAASCPTLLVAPISEVGASWKVLCTLLGWNAKLSALISRDPALLLVPPRAMRSALDWLRTELGISASQAAACAIQQPQLLKREPEALEAQMLELASDLGVSEAYVRQCLRRCPSLFSHEVASLTSKVAAFQRLLGVSHEQVVKLVLRVPALLTHSTATISHKLDSLAHLLASVTSSTCTQAQPPSCSARDCTQRPSDAPPGTGSFTSSGEWDYAAAKSAVAVRLVLCEPHLLTQSPKTLHAKMVVISDLLGLTLVEAKQLVLRCPSLLALPTRQLKLRMQQLAWVIEGQLEQELAHQLASMPPDQPQGTPQHTSLGSTARRPNGAQVPQQSQELQQCASQQSPQPQHRAGMTPMQGNMPEQQGGPLIPPEWPLLEASQGSPAGLQEDWSAVLGGLLGAPRCEAVDAGRLRKAEQKRVRSQQRQGRAQARAVQEAVAALVRQWPEVLVDVDGVPAELLQSTVSSLSALGVRKQRQKKLRLGDLS